MVGYTPRWFTCQPTVTHPSSNRADGLTTTPRRHTYLLTFRWLLLPGAPAGKRIIIFVDDLNMPKLDTYGSQPPIELLRQYQDFGGLYDREKLFWKEINVSCFSRHVFVAISL